MRLGHCTWGESCWYLHDLSTLAESSSSSSSEVAKKADRKADVMASTSGSKASLPLSANPSKGSRTTTTPLRPAAQTAPAPPPEPCVICFEDAPQVYGLLEKCGHAFCLDCIRSWRNPSTKDSPTALSGVIKTCPACRAPSAFITPSPKFFGDSDPMKLVTIENYKAKLSKIPCKSVFFRSNKSIKSFFTHSYAFPLGILPGNPQILSVHSVCITPKLPFVQKNNSHS